MDRLAWERQCTDGGNRGNGQQVATELGCKESQPNTNPGRSCHEKLRARPSARTPRRAAAGSEPVGRASDAERALLEDVGVDHGGAELAMTEEFLHRPDVRSVSSRCVAKEWRKVWQLTRFEMPALRRPP
jgi:hypothetical protein